MPQKGEGCDSFEAVQICRDAASVPLPAACLLASSSATSCPAPSQLVLQPRASKPTNVLFDPFRARSSRIGLSPDHRHQRDLGLQIRSPRPPKNTVCRPVPSGGPPVHPLSLSSAPCVTQRLARLLRRNIPATITSTCPPLPP